VSSAADRIAIATAEIVKENSTTRLQLDIEIATPIFIIPVATLSPDFLELALGNKQLSSSSDPLRKNHSF